MLMLLATAAVAVTVLPKNGFISLDALTDDFGMRGATTALVAPAGSGQWFHDEKPCATPPGCWDLVATQAFPAEPSCVDVFDRTALVCIQGSDCRVYDISSAGWTLAATLPNQGTTQTATWGAGCAIYGTYAAITDTGRVEAWRSDDYASWTPLGEFFVPGATGLPTAFPVAIFDDLLVFGTDTNAVVTVFDLQNAGSATTLVAPDGCGFFGFEVDVAFGSVVAPCTSPGAREVYVFPAHQFNSPIFVSSSTNMDYADHVGFTGTHLTLTSASAGKTFCHSM